MQRIGLSAFSDLTTVEQKMGRFYFLDFNW
jgi:hypothetical protein